MRGERTGKFEAHSRDGIPSCSVWRTLRLAKLIRHDAYEVEVPATRRRVERAAAEILWNLFEFVDPIEDRVRELVELDTRTQSQLGAFTKALDFGPKFQQRYERAERDAAAFLLNLALGVAEDQRVSTDVRRTAALAVGLLVILFDSRGSVPLFASEKTLDRAINAPGIGRSNRRALHQVRAGDYRGSDIAKLVKASWAQFEIADRKHRGRLAAGGSVEPIADSTTRKGWKFELRRGERTLTLNGPGMQSAERLLRSKPGETPKRFINDGTAEAVVLVRSAQRMTARITDRRRWSRANDALKRASGGALELKRAASSDRGRIEYCADHRDADVSVSRQLAALIDARVSRSLDKR